VVGFYYQVVRLVYKWQHVGCDGAGIGDDAEIDALNVDEEAHVLAGVVGYAERRDVEGAKREGFAGGYVSPHVCRQFALYAVVAVNAIVNGGGGVYGKMEFVADAAYGFDVVSVVVSDEDVVDVAKGESEVAKVFFECS